MLHTRPASRSLEDGADTRWGRLIRSHGYYIEKENLDEHLDEHSSLSPIGSSGQAVRSSDSEADNFAAMHWS